MIELNLQQTQCVAAGFLTNLDLELNDQQMKYLKTRSLVGLLSGVILGLNLTPEYFLLSSLAGFMGGFSIGTVEAWAWSY
tara:strand:+ start:5750 stop:5989 length:240 start_codon:yes stop_codon:yes gene_type:complete